MSFSLVKVKFQSVKHCFVTLSASCVSARANNDIRVFELELDTGKVYVSWSGEVIRSSGSADRILQINGLYGAKLGLKDGEDLIVRPVSVIKDCKRVNLEPLTVDDWEIIERNTVFIETHLLDQLRVVWMGQVFPVWVESNTCVFLKVGQVEPETDCALLCNETEVILAPKVRKHSRPVPIEEPIQKSVTNVQEKPFLPSADSIYADDEPRFASGDSLPEFENGMKDFNKLAVSRNSDRKRREKSPNISNISSQWQGLLWRYLPFSVFRGKLDESEDSEEEDEADSIDQSDVVLQNGLNLVLRTQPMKYTVTEKDNASSLTVQQSSRSGSSSPRKRSMKSGSSSPRKGSKENLSVSDVKSNFRINFVPQQPTTVFMDRTDIENQLKCNRQDIPCVFIAKLQKLLSPKEQEKAKRDKAAANGRNGKNVPKKVSDNKTDKSGSTTPDDLDSPESPNIQEMETIAAGGLSCYVRVVVIDRRREFCNDLYSPVVGRVLEEQPLLSGHMIVADMLRRQLKLDISSRVWIQTLKGGLTRACEFTLYSLGNKAASLSPDKLSLLFRQWLEQVSSEDYPLLVFQGIFISFPAAGQIAECQLTYTEADPAHKGSYTLLHPGVFRSGSVTLHAVSGSRMHELSHPAIQPMLAYTSISSIDPQIQEIDMKNLGGVTELLDLAVSNVEICLGSRPLYQTVFLTTPGLINGMLLLTGAKGSGKSSVVRALSRHVAELPNLAHILVMDCKHLRGKKVDTIQKIFELLFDEAAWRQPSLIVLDDLDHIAAAPAGPEFEMSGEALYSARVAEVVKDLLRKDIRNMSRIAVLATSQSRSSLHPILVSSRGTHLVQEVMQIKAPNKEQRKEILLKIINNKVFISNTAMNDLDLDAIAQKTEGFVARDLVNIVNRAIHAYILANGPGINSDVVLELSQDNFETALCGFTPASIRNVPLHQAGELGWNDIGGLTDVKSTLVETLQWPTKYPALFANCPLRLRSGLLLYGAPGTGKTLLAGVVGKECGLNFISIKGPELLSKYIGASEQAVRETFNRAQSAKPCILFFDEFDSMAPRRGHDNTGVTDRVVNQLLTQLDGVEGLDGVYVLAATSRPDLIDPALLRPGRLDKCLHCQMPNEEERFKILEALSKKISVAQDVDLQYFAKYCEDFTGADFKALLYNAQLEAIHEFTSDESDGNTGRYGMKTKKGPHSKLKSRGSGQNLKLKSCRDIASEFVGFLPDPRLLAPRSCHRALATLIQLKANEQLISFNKTEARRKSFSSGTVAYIPNLTEGIKQVNPEMEERLNAQVSQINLRERRNSEHISEDRPDSPLAIQKALQVSQRHMLAAVSRMRPSVSAEERLKYKRIYENFISAREGNFSMAHLESLGMKATLA